MSAPSSISTTKAYFDFSIHHEDYFSRDATPLTTSATPLTTSVTPPAASTTPPTALGSFFDFGKDYEDYFPTRAADRSPAISATPPTALDSLLDDLLEIPKGFQFCYTPISPLPSNPLSSHPPKRMKFSVPSGACEVPPLIPTKPSTWSLECRCKLLDLASNPAIRDSYLTEVCINEFAQELLKQYGIRYSSQEVQNELTQLQARHPKVFLDFETAFSTEILGKIRATWINKDSSWTIESRCYLLQIAHKEPSFKRDFKEISLFLFYKTGLSFSKQQLDSQLLIMKKKSPLLKS